MPETQDIAGERRKRGRPRKVVAEPDGPKRKRGGQPGNTNAVKTPPEADLLTILLASRRALAQLAALEKRRPRGKP